MNLPTALLLACLAAPAFAQTARQLNSQGFKEYKAKRYPEAAALFRRAVEKDPKLAVAHYNLACTLSLLRHSPESVCRYEAYRDTVIEHLTRSVELEPQRKQKMQTDPDLNAVRDTVGYQKLLGLTPGNPEDLPALVERVSWWGPGVGMWGTMQGVDFKPDGTLLLWKSVLLTEDAVQPTRNNYPGTYRVEGGKVLIKLNQPLEGKTDFTGTLSAEGILDFGEPLGRFYDHPSECSA